MSYQWRTVKDNILRNRGIVVKDEAIKFDRTALKSEHAKAYLQWFMDNHCDCLPATPSDNTSVKCAPFASISAFHEEYQASTKAENYDVTRCAQLTVFSTVYNKYFIDKLRLMKCKVGL